MNENVTWTGGLFLEEERDGPTELAFKYAVYRINKDRTLLPNMTLLFDIQYTQKDDSFHATKKGKWITSILL
jgi:ionotropic kainate glutamate receptor 2